MKLDLKTIPWILTSICLIAILIMSRIYCVRVVGTPSIDSTFIKKESKYQDSITALIQKSALLKKSTDSINEQLQEAKGKYKIASIKIDDLNHKLAKALNNKDTKNTVILCDSLQQAVQYQSIKIDSLVYAYDAAMQNNAKHIYAKDSIISIQQGMYNVLKVEYIKKSNALAKCLASPKQNDGRISIGLQSGIGIGYNIKPTPYIGIGVQYTLFKFR